MESGYLYRLKKALEQNGFAASDEVHKRIKIIQLEEQTLEENKKGAQFDSLENVIKSLQ